VKIEYLEVSTDKFLGLVSNICKASRQKKNKNNYISTCQQQRVRKCKRRKRIKKDTICNSIKIFQIPSYKSNKKHI